MGQMDPQGKMELLEIQATQVQMVLMENVVIPAMMVLLDSLALL